MELDPLDASQDASSHPTPETLERYALGCLSEPHLSQLETHLLICHDCQDALAETDDYVGAMKAVLAEPAPGSWDAFVAKFPVSLRNPATIPALLLMVAIGSLAILLPRSHEPEVPSIVLRSGRGSIRDLAAQGPAHSPLRIRIQSQYLRTDRSFQAKIVDAIGNPVWEGIPEFTNENGYVLQVHTPLDEGRYWVRLYTAEQEFLQEYGLLIK